MIEVKVSRADFLRDKKKLFRWDEDKGVGNFRYYCCPRQLIGPLEVPDGWGLIYVYPNGNARQVLSPNHKKANYEAERNILYSYARRAVVKGHHASIMTPMIPAQTTDLVDSQPDDTTESMKSGMNREVAS